MVLIPKRKASGIRLSQCLPIFLVAIVSLNVLIVGWWMNKEQSLAKPPNEFETFASEKPMQRQTVTKLPPLVPVVPVVDVTKQDQHVVDTDMMKQANADVVDVSPDESVAAGAVARSDNKADAPVVVAHVVSLIKCSKSVTGFLDAAAVFRHSIHQQSFSTGKSKYSYKMYAIVHEQCQDHGQILERLGYTVLVKPPPIRVDEIQEGWYRNHVENENCCGSAEFIKLYAYELMDHEIVVHWDMDVAVLQSMDDLFDAMLFDKDSKEGRAARERLEVQHPSQPLPDKIDAYFTRDVTSAQPWESAQGVQGGFLVARPSREDFQTYLNFIRLGNYTAGRGDGTGWNALGYGGFQGAMAYQGVVAFFYDHFKPNTAVELAACRWNQVVADVLWRGPAKMQHHLQCREHPKDGNYEANTKCEDCRVTPIELVKTVHYTACKKPWECSLPTPRVPRNKEHIYRLSHLTNVTTCGRLFAKWFELRSDLEQQLKEHHQYKPADHEGSFEPDYFMGYCQRAGGYIPMNPPPDGFDMKELYGI